MARYLIPIIFALSAFARAEDSLWQDNKLTPAQPFPGRVLAVETSWIGYYLIIESLGDGDKRYCIAQVEAAGSPHLAYKEIRKSDLPKPSRSMIFLNPSIDIDYFSWSIGAWKIGRIFGEEDCLKKAIVLEAELKNRKSEAAPSDADKPPTAPIVKQDPWKSSDYSVLAVEGRFAAYIGILPVVIDARLRDKNPKSYLEAIESFGPAFTSRVSSSGIWEWHFNDGMTYRVQPCWSGPLAKPISLKLEKTHLQIIDDKTPKTE